MERPVASEIPFAQLAGDIELLEHKPAYERYLEDIRLAVLNEYVEYIEYNLNEPMQERDAVFGYYYPHAVELAKEIHAASIFHFFSEFGSGQ